MPYVLFFTLPVGHAAPFKQGEQRSTHIEGCPFETHPKMSAAQGQTVHFSALPTVPQQWHELWPGTLRFLEQKIGADMLAGCNLVRHVFKTTGETA
jgi:hypothetical protein